MVKARDRIPDRASRRRRRFEDRLSSHHRSLLHLASFSPSKDQQNHPFSATTTTTTQETLPTKAATVAQKSPVTPSSLSIRRRIRLMKRSRSRSPSNSSSSRSKLKSESKSLSFSPTKSISCSSSSSSPKISFSPLNFTLSPNAPPAVGPTSPENSPLPPLPPHPSPELLRRSVSDPVKLLTHLSGETSFSPMKSSSSRPVSRNLMGQLPPLPPSSSPSSLLRRTISDPVHLQSSASMDENEKKKMKEQAVEAERLSGEWIVVKFSCNCGKDGHYLVNASDKKYFKLI
ncbi:hypothetical protein RND81_13G117400 [Saponaria officinalis]|uniref:Uncharacterized protein n=1 Tax=Saponaria officinalis TaxID=3572 RepID=A0AAW1H1C5_SAPOF